MARSALRTRSGTAVRTAVVLFICGLLAGGGPFAAQAATTDDDAPAQEDGAQGQEPAAAGIDLIITAVTGDGADDGDLVLDEGTDLPTLFFSPSSAEDKTAVHEYTITNTGDTALHQVTLVDDRLGTILDGADGNPLEPGGTITVRASEVFTFADAAGGVESLLAWTAVATGTDDQDIEVSATDDAAIQLVAVLPSPTIELTKQAVVGAGDVAEDADGAPVVTWQEAEFDANQPKTVRYRFTLTNTGDTALAAVELYDAMLSDAPVIAASDGVELEPGESTVVDVDHTVTPQDVFPADPIVVDGHIQGDLLNTAEVRATAVLGGGTAIDTAQAAVLVRAPRAETLPAAGPEDANALLPAGLLLMWFGVAVLWTCDRRLRLAR